MPTGARVAREQRLENFRKTLDKQLARAAAAPSLGRDARCGKSSVQ